MPKRARTWARSRHTTHRAYVCVLHPFWFYRRSSLCTDHICWTSFFTSSTRFLADLSFWIAGFPQGRAEHGGHSQHGCSPQTGACMRRKRIEASFLHQLFDSFILHCGRRQSTKNTQRADGQLSGLQAFQFSGLGGSAHAAIGVG